jgi:hypothetical protein
MPSFERSRATLRIAGDLLVPDKVSRMLGSEPTDSQQKGDEILGQSTGQVRIARTGMWRLEAQTREPEDLCGQIDEILGKLTNDRDVWADIRRSFSIDLFCGLFMGSGNDGISLTPERLQALGERGIELALDIYDSTD